jgi:hypothetical protein
MKSRSCGASAELLHLTGPSTPRFHLGLSRIKSAQDLTSCNYFHRVASVALREVVLWFMTVGLVPSQALSGRSTGTRNPKPS